MNAKSEKKPSAKKIKLIGDYRITRLKLKLNQAEFWNRVGSTQSAGSRYEAGRAVPIATAILAYKIYVLGEDIDAADYVSVKGK